MGYTTEFHGAFRLEKALEATQIAYLKQLCRTRRVKRDPAIAGTLPDPLREAVGLPIGEDGEYFVGGTGYAGQDRDASVLEHNRPPASQPSLWCGWTANDNGLFIEWNRVEKFYNYVQWLEYLIERFVVPWGHVLDGEVTRQGEEDRDQGLIVVERNRVSAI